MSTVTQNASSILPEYAVDNLGVSFSVILVNSAKRVFDKKIDDYKIVIPDEDGLMRAVAIARSIHESKLSGKDIRFIRKSLGLKAKDLAEHLDISAEHLSRCESGEKVLSPNSEKLLRLLVLLEPAQVLEKAIEDSDESNAETISELIAYGRAIRRLVSDMKIMPASNDVGLMLKFCYKPLIFDMTPSPANDDWPDGKWDNSLLPKVA